MDNSESVRHDLKTRSAEEFAEEDSPKLRRSYKTKPRRAHKRGREAEGLAGEEEVEEGEEVADKVEEADKHKVAGKGVTLGTHHEPVQEAMIKKQRTPQEKGRSQGHTQSRAQLSQSAMARPTQASAQTLAPAPSRSPAPHRTSTQDISLAEAPEEVQHQSSRAEDYKAAVAQSKKKCSCKEK